MSPTTEGQKVGTPVTHPEPRRGFTRAGISQEAVVIAVTALLFLGLSVFLKGFLSVGNLLTLLRSVAVLGILGVGMAIVVLGKGLDLSMVSIMAICSAWTLQLMNDGWSSLGAIAMAMGLAVLVGIINGVAVSFIEMPPLFTTLATGMLLFGVGRARLLNGMIAYVPANRERYLHIGQGLFAGIPIPVWIFAGMALGMHLFLSRSTLGRFTYAQGDNYEAARLSGMPVRPLTVMHYVISALVAGLSGVVLSAEVASMNTQIFSSTLIFDVILVVVLGGVSLLGGRGSILSVLCGTALIGTVLNGMIILNFDNNVQNIVKSAVLLGAIIVDNRLHPRDEETARQGDI